MTRYNRILWNIAYNILSNQSEAYIKYHIIKDCEEALDKVNNSIENNNIENMLELAKHENTFPWIRDIVITAFEHCNI